MKFSKYFICDKDGKSNCVIRSFCKCYNKKYEDVYNSLCDIAKNLKYKSFNEIEVFESFMKNNNTILLNYGKNLKIKDLDLEDGKYIVFCWDKKDLYHMVTIIDNILYDKNDDSLNLYVIKIYKKN